MAPRSTKAAAQALPTTTFVIDNGAYSLKAGFASSSGSTDADALSKCHVIPNALARTRSRRTYIGAQLDTHVDNWNEATFRRPVERGQLVNWEAEKEIWDHSFFQADTARRDLLVKSPQDTTLLVTEAPNTMPALQKNADEIILEEWGFGGYARCIGPSLNAYNDLHPLFGNPIVKATDPTCPEPIECLLVVDSGYSSTTITPLYNSHPLNRAIRRIDFGGKHLTNLLKEVVSIRHLDLHQDVKIVNDMKEEVCYVSNNFKFDLEQTWKGNRKKRGPPKSSAPDGELEDRMDISNDQTLSKPPVPDPSILIDYILPDYFTTKKGFSRPHDPLAASLKRKSGLTASPSASPSSSETLLTLGSERFTVPEIIFSPSDIGSPQSGLAESIMQSLSTLPPLIQASLLPNILLVGGNAKIPGFRERLEREVRALAAAECLVRVRCMEDPVKSTWLGGARMSWNAGAMREKAVTKHDYEEYGSGWVGRKFAGLATGR